MKKNYTGLQLLVLICIAITGGTLVKVQAGDAISGDTTVVQTFRYDTTMRAGMFQFPDDSTKSYEKIIMLYSMRCKNGLVSNSGQPNQGCGEWDYNCYTYLVDSAQTDSMRRISNSYAISNFTDTVYPYTIVPQWNYYQTIQQEVTYTSTISESTATIGNGAALSNVPFDAASPLSRTQYLWTASELINAGFTAGNVNGLEMDLFTLGSTLENLRIRIKNTSRTILDSQSPELNGFAEVFYQNTTFTAAGANRFNFHTPFSWDGVSSVLMDISFNNVNAGMNNQVFVSGAANIASLHTTAKDKYLDTDGGLASITLPSGVGDTVTDQVTLAFWCYGNPIILPANTSILEALDAGGERQMNIHLPWSDGSIYWDCGNNGSGYDRISRAATISEMEGQWNFWTFTKNASTGIMYIFLNGSLWHSGSGKTKPISINRMNLGRSIANNYGYYGSLDEFSMWSIALDSVAISDIMYHSITPSNPAYANLLVYYKMDESSGALIDDSSPNGMDGTMFNMTRRDRRGKDLFRNFTESLERPKISFIRGVYTTSVQVTPVLDSLAINANSVIEYTVQNNTLAAVDTNLYWQAGGYSYVYDTAGVAIDSIPVAADDTIFITRLTHYEKRPMKVELINFITPYGLGLNMNGLIGKTWAFDVTDYAPVLKGRKFMAMEDGKYQEDNDIRFVFYEGTPPRDVHALQQVWPSGAWTMASYGQIANNDMFEPRDIPLSANSAQFKLRSAISGHGQEGEFIPRNHTLRLNNSTNYTRAVWKECAMNPIYPQGGTWVYDRAGWCPGDVVDTKEYDITPQVSPGQVINLDYSLPVVSNTGTSNYRVNNQLVSYGAPNFNLDAAVSYVKSPSNRVEFERLNPICNAPVIAIQNTGATPLTQLDITYGRLGGTMASYQWTGTLNFLQTAEVTLPQPNWLSSNTNEFIVIVTNPNGGTDQYGLNDTLITTFNYPVVYTSGLVFELKTNTSGSQTSYTLKDSQGNNLINRIGLAANTTYRDTVYLPTDCYTLKLLDAGDDGLSWWANPGQGTGYFRIKDAATGTNLRTFNPDFGDNIYQQFTVNYTLPTVEVQPGQAGNLTVFPNPASGLLNVEFSLPVYAEGEIAVVNIVGQTLMTQKVFVSQPKEKVSLDISPLESGIYYIVLRSGNEKVMQKVVITR
ncbi:MAG: T9SS type A sorting domain-containing protein [Bacteroidetes bacterium]|nr:T9SS type A sorting domain-containing protein [Bacteroidota bacterium]